MGVENYACAGMTTEQMFRSIDSGLSLQELRREYQTATDVLHYADVPGLYDFIQAARPVMDVYFGEQPDYTRWSTSRLQQEARLTQSFDHEFLTQCPDDLRADYQKRADATPLLVAELTSRGVAISS